MNSAFAADDYFAKFILQKIFFHFVEKIYRLICRTKQGLYHLCKNIFEVEISNC